MSGEPRSRKLKKRKRDERKSEGELIFSRKLSVQEDDESSHGVHITKMGTDDVHLHVQHEHGTGGHWCAKVIFFALMAILLSLVALIILENRGLSNTDTPLSESRFSNYFDGWVEEHRADEHHDAVKAALEEHDEHDDEPFEEEEDHSEIDDEEEDEDHEVDDEEQEGLAEDHDEDEEDVQNEVDENEEDEQIDEDVTEETTVELTQEEVDEEEDEEYDDDYLESRKAKAKHDVDDEDEDIDDDVTKEVDEDENITPNADDDDDDIDNNEVDNDDDDDDNDDKEKTIEDNNDDDDNEDDNDNEDDDENIDNTANVSKNDDEEDNEELEEEQNSRVDNNENEDNDDDDNDDDEEEEAVEPILTRSTQHSTTASRQDNNDNDDPFDEDDDDGTFESLENVIDNDAEELKLLQEKARQQAPPPSDDQDDEINENGDDKAAPSVAFSIAVKIGVGLALALVSRFVLIRKNPNTNDEPDAELLMKRRLTIANEEVTNDENEEAPPLSDDELGDELEEEIEYVEEEEIEIEVDENGEEIKLPPVEKYVPETFEDLKAMYRPKSYIPEPAEAPPPPAPKPTTPNMNRIEKFRAEKYGRQMPTNDSPRTTLNAQSTLQKQSPIVFTASATPTQTSQQPPQPPPRLTEPKLKSTNYTPLATAAATTAATVATAAALSQSIPDRTEQQPQQVQLPRDIAEPAQAQTEVKTREVTHDLDYRPENYEYDDDDDDDYGEEELVEEEEEEIEDIMDDDDDLDDASDVDDTELMSRLEAKYGRLPSTKDYESDEDADDPTWTQIKPKSTENGGAQAHEDEIDDDDMFERDLRRANEEMMRERYSIALQSFNTLSQKYPDQPAAFLGKAKCLDKLSEQQRSNKLLEDALDAYKRYLALSDLIQDAKEFRQTAEHCIERMRFLGYYNQAIPIHQQLVGRFPKQPEQRNQLAVTYLMMNRLADAKTVLRETLKHWPENGFALVHYGFVLKNYDHDYATATQYLQKGIDTQEDGTQDGRFFFNLGDAYQRLGLTDKAYEIYQRGAELKLFPSTYQRSLYNERNLRAQPYWSIEQTTYAQHLKKFEYNWQAIRDEGLSLLSQRGYFVDEAENLRDTGDWKQFELYARGQRRHKNCLQAPITCSIIEEFKAAAGCRRGQVKFSVMHGGTHVFPHCGPTNCRLRAHLGLVVPQGTRLRVANEERNWTEGKFLIFDDSFEHEVWHEGSTLRLVLIVDVWHPDLSEQQRQSLPPI